MILQIFLTRTLQVGIIIIEIIKIDHKRKTYLDVTKGKKIKRYAK